MKKLLSTPLLVFIIASILLQSSCIDRVKQVRNFVANKPIYMSYENMRASVKPSETRPLVHPGKMYFYNNYIFISEISEGIHVVDNTNPENPEIINFITVPGNVDIAVKDDKLYADSYVDLVVLDISDINNISEINRIKDVFEYRIPEYDTQYPLAQIDENEGVVVGWENERIEEESIDSWRGGVIYYDVDDATEASGNDNSQGGGVGIAGSTARFAIYENALYLLNRTMMYVYNISQTDSPEHEYEFLTNRESETLFVKDDLLYSGTQTGMVVYSLSNPFMPNEISSFNHIQSCDPVVVEDDYAYVTLRAGSGCGGNSNQLDVIDLSSILSPRLVKSYPLVEPYGLGMRNGTLYICDGRDGLKVYDASDPLRISDNIIQHFSDIHAYDVIPLENTLLLIGVDGFYQYSYSPGGELTELSLIPVERE